MPNQPTISQVHVDVPLTNMSVAYVQNNDNYLAGRLFATVPVNKRSGKFFKFNKHDFMRDEAKKRAPGTESAGGGFNVTTDTYSCERWAFHKDVDDETRDMHDAPLDADRSATEFVTQKLLIKRDVQTVSTLIVPSIWSTDRDGVAAGPTGDQFLQWNDANSTPIEDVQESAVSIHTETSFMPNVFGMGLEVFNVVRRHPDMLDVIKYTQKGIVTEELLAAIWGIPEVLVAKGVYATSAEGAATQTMAQILGKRALLAYRESSPAIDKPSAAYVFSYSKFDRVKRGGAAMKKFRMEKLDSDRVEGEMHFDPKLVAADCGIFWDTVVA